MEDCSLQTAPFKGTKLSRVRLHSYSFLALLLKILESATSVQRIENSLISDNVQISVEELKAIISHLPLVSLAVEEHENELLAIQSEGATYAIFISKGTIEMEKNKLFNQRYENV